MRTLSEGSFEGKTVLVRADLDSDFVNGKVLKSERIKAASVTISELKKKKARVVVIAHQGRPGKDDCVSLKAHARFLNKYVKIKFVKDIIGITAEEEIIGLKNGQAILLENVRFLKEEMTPSENNIFVNTLSNLCSAYVNDAFSVSHRNQTSMVSFPKKLDSYVGRALEKELNALTKVDLGDFMFILGGAKPEDNMKLLIGNKVLACGLFGQLCTIAKGKDLGAQNLFLKDKIPLVDDIKYKLDNVETPIDFAVKVKGKRKEILLENFPSEYEIFDIGENTINKYTEMIKNARAIYMKGPAGFSADKQFSKGTFAILNAIAKSKAFSIIGGGHLSDAIRDSKISVKKFGHVSLSGGALLSYLAGEKLPALVALGIQ